MTAETAPRPTPTQWLAGARPRTLPAACSPVIAGTGLAVFEQGASWVAAVLALVVSLALQVGVELRQRLLRRHPRHGHRTRRSTAAGRFGSGVAAAGEDERRLPASGLPVSLDWHL